MAHSKSGTSVLVYIIYNQIKSGSSVTSFLVLGFGSWTRGPVWPGITWWARQSINWRGEGSHSMKWGLCTDRVDPHSVLAGDERLQITRFNALTFLWI
jgi:hypothetical protein